MSARLVHAGAAVVLLAMAWLQLNDPDPLYWVGVYVAVAWVPLQRLRGRREGRYWFVVLGLVVAGLLMSGVGFWQFLHNHSFADLTASMQAMPAVEAAREFLGLIIALTIILGYRYR